MKIICPSPNDFSDQILIKLKKNFKCNFKEIKQNKLNRIIKDYDVEFWHSGGGCRHLAYQINVFDEAFSTAIGMSLISMLAMEIAMNTVDVVLTGGVIVWWVLPPMLLAGFITPLPYNYYRLKKYNLECH